MRCAHRQRPQPKEKGTVWVLTTGTRGDHEPVLALAAGLKAAGHRVKVFGMGYFRDLFLALGLDFEPLTRPPLLHEGNKLRATVQRRALGAGFEGENGLMDYLLDLFILQREYRARRFQQLVEEGKSEFEIFISAIPLFVELGGVKAGRTDNWEERNREWLQWRAQEAKTSWDRCAARRAEFRKFWHELAAEKKTDAVTAFEAFEAAFQYRPGAEPLSLWASEALAWHSSTGLSEWFGKFQSAKPRWLFDGTPNWPPGTTSDEGFYKWGLENLLSSFDAAEHKPDVLLYHFVTSVQAWGLRHLRGVDLLPMWITPTFPQSLSVRLAFFKMWVGGEKIAGCGNPIASAGPWIFFSTQETPWNVVGLSRLRLDSEDRSCRLDDGEGWLATVRSCFTGSWNLDDMPEVPQLAEAFYSSASDRERLRRFLAEGEPPVCFTWGSMQHSKGPAALASLLVRTLRLTGHRGVLVVSWSGVRTEDLGQAFRAEYPSAGREEAEARLLVLPTVRPDELLPSCVAVVHHGGAGTTHAVLRAGTPAVVTPFLLDQPGNGNWVQDLGCGLGCDLLERLTAEDLAEKLQRVVENEEMKAKAKEVAAQMLAEPGVAGAVQLVEKFLRERPQPDATAAVRARTCPDGVYTWKDHLGNPLASVPYRGGTGQADPNNPGAVSFMRWGRFVTWQEGAQEWRPYDVQLVDFLTEIVARGTFSSDGNIISFDDMPFSLQVPRSGCAVS